MGFRPFAAAEIVRARFSYLNAIAIEGLTVASVEMTSMTIKGQMCRVAIASTLNKACQALVSDDYTADESEWQRVKVCCGPYALAVFGPTEEYTASTGLIKEEADGSITTYDCFPAAKASCAVSRTMRFPSCSRP